MHLGRVAHALGLTAALFALWLILSGHYTPVLVAFGALSSAVVVLVLRHMRILDGEGQPLQLLAAGLRYWAWLLWEIIKANWDVTKVIVDRRLPISPALFEAPTTQKSDLGRVIYANSITLTPGTISVDMPGDRILVHALTQAGADGVLSGDMDRRVTAMEGSR
jgi:multicomponent Na+:H+ antiporter subunit E